MKRLIVCCDGTWQKLTSPYPTNVVKITQAIKPSCQKGIAQIVFYDEGVGAGNTAEKVFAEGDKILGGAFGIGIDNIIQDAYRFLSLNYEPNDEIYLFGFSRGSYTVRSLAGLIRCSGGLLSPKNIREAPLAYDIYRDPALTLKEKERFRKLPIPREYGTDADKIKELRAKAHQIYSDRTRVSLKDAQKGTPEVKGDLQLKEGQVQELLLKSSFAERNDADIRQAAKITLLGCWDTVGSLGVPNHIPFLTDWVNTKYKFHDTFLSSIIQNALHAVAIDEIREVFNVTCMDRQSDDPKPLHQVWFPGDHGCVGGGSHARRGLSDAALEWMMDQICNSDYGLGLGLAFDRTAVEDGIVPDWKINFDNTPKGIYKLLGQVEREISPCQFASLHGSTIHRWHDRSDYRPHSLKPYENELKAWQAASSLIQNRL